MICFFFRRCPRSLLVISFNIEVVASLIVEVIDYGEGNHIGVYVRMEVMILRPMNISIPHGMMIRCAHRDYAHLFPELMDKYAVVTKNTEVLVEQC